MRQDSRITRPGFHALAVLACALGSLGFPGDVNAQGPSIDVDDPPGVSRGGSKLGDAIGAAGATRFQNVPGSSDAPIGGRAGPSVSRAPINGLNPRTSLERREGGPNFKVPALPAAPVPAYGELDLPEGQAAVGSLDGLTLDQAIEMMIRENLSIIAMRYEIPMADADVLTASLRANPVFYADAQLVPYGRYTRERPGGQTQYDVNITYPLDVSRKRQARTEVARIAKNTIEAQFQDAVRQQIDNLYTAYVNVAAAELTANYSRKFVDGIGKLLTINRELFQSGQIARDPTDVLASQLEQAQLQVREADQALTRTTRTLAQLLNIPRDQALSIRIQDEIRNETALPQEEGQLIDLALQNRPDLLAFRLGVRRAEAEVTLAKRERLSDFYLLAQPYTLQDNRPFGLKSPVSWAVGLTAPLPVYNRNQGNIQRAKINVSQTQVELAQLERQIQDEVADAVQEFELSLTAVLEIEREILPAARRVRDSALRRFQGGNTTVIEYLEAQKDFNERVRDYRDSLVRHRRAMLDLNTAVGVRIVP